MPSWRWYGERVDNKKISRFQLEDKKNKYLQIDELNKEQILIIRNMHAFFVKVRF